MDISLNTIEYLMNPIHRHIIEKKTNEASKQFRQEIKFYKKRILQTTRNLIKGENMEEGIVDMFLLYCRTLIQHFKIIDENDIMQETYADISINCVSSEILSNNEYLTADNLIMRTNNKKKRIDEYIDIKRHSNKSEPILHHKREVNLRNPELRTKGVRRKKNIVNTHDKDP